MPELPLLQCKCGYTSDNHPEDKTPLSPYCDCPDCHGGQMMPLVDCSSCDYQGHNQAGKRCPRCGQSTLKAIIHNNVART